MRWPTFDTWCGIAVPFALLAMVAAYSEVSWSTFAVAVAWFGYGFYLGTDHGLGFGRRTDLGDPS